MERSLLTDPHAGLLQADMSEYVMKRSIDTLLREGS